METTPISPQMRMYYRRKEAGLCVNCGKVKSDENFKTCTKCRNKQKIKKNKGCQEKLQT